MAFFLEEVGSSYLQNVITPIMEVEYSKMSEHTLILVILACIILNKFSDEEQINIQNSGYRVDKPCLWK